MKQYEKNIKSNWQWYDVVPENWASTRLKYPLQNIIGGGTPSTGNIEYWDDENGMPWVSIADITSSEGYLETTQKRITPKAISETNLKIIPKGTLCISIFASLGKTTILGVDATVNQAILGLITDEKILMRDFLKYYLMFSENFISYFSSANTQENLNLTKIKNLPIYLPSIEEQTAIANFLDEKNKQITQLIFNKQKLIELLKEERTTTVNEAVNGEGKNWVRKKLKYVCNITDCKHITPEYIDIGIPVVSTGNVKPTKISLESARKVSQFNFEQLCEGGRKPQKGDIIYSRNASVGAAALVRTEEEFCLGQDICLIRSNEIQEFLEIVFNSSYFFSQLESVLVGSTFKRINIEQIQNFEIALPSIKEQTVIIQRIQTETHRIDNTVSIIEKEIKLMQEYRTALISEAVTGKIKVI